MPSYVALLRGINVGGKNLIKMPALKACFEADGFEDVATYIQSGNVLFSSPETKGVELASRIETTLSETFGYSATVVVRSHRQMRAIVARAPKGFGAEPATYRNDVIFLKEPLLARTAIKAVPTNPEVDEIHGGPGVLYFSRLISDATRSRLNRIITSPIYPNVTIRNWNTTSKVLRMMDEAS